MTGERRREIRRWIIRDEWAHFRALLGPVPAVYRLAHYYGVPVSWVASIVYHEFGEHIPKQFLEEKQYACA